MHPKLVLDYIKDKLPEVAKMIKPLTENEAKVLLDRYGSKAVLRQLENMENYTKLQSKRSAFLTCLKWFEEDIKKGYVKLDDLKMSAKQDKEADNRRFVQEFLKEHPVGSEYKASNGKVYIVDSEIFIRDAQGGANLPIISLKGRLL